MNYTTSSTTLLLPFHQVLVRARESILLHGFIILSEINTQEIMLKNGININAVRQILFFHPKYMKRILEQCPKAIAEAPLKIAIIENEVLGCQLIYSIPQSSFEDYPELDNLGKELQTKLELIIKGVK